MTPNGPAQKKIRNGFLYDDDNYKKAHEAFRRLSVVCNHIARPLQAAAAADDDLDT